MEKVILILIWLSWIVFSQEVDQLTRAMKAVTLLCDSLHSMMWMPSTWRSLFEMEKLLIVALLTVMRTAMTSTVHALFFFPKLEYSIVTGSGALF
jgi:hypothetical protein